MTKQQMDLIRELRAIKCRCGSSKPPGKTFCHSCYHSLPDRIKKDLYKRIGAGYEEAYEAAVSVLQDD